MNKKREEEAAIPVENELEKKEDKDFGDEDINDLIFGKGKKEDL